MYGLLENLVAGPKFLAKLSAARAKHSENATDFHGREVLEPSWWEPPAQQPAPELSPASGPEADGFEQASTW